MKKYTLLILLIVFSFLVSCSNAQTNNNSSLGDNSFFNEESSNVQELVLEEIDSSEIKEVEITLEAQILLTNNGEVYSWGLNDQGVLGLGITDNEKISDYPTKIQFDEPIKDIVTNPNVNSVIAIAESGNVYAWGPNHYNIFPNINEEILYSPQKLEIPFEAKSASLSYRFLTVEDINGNFYGCGWNMEGHLEYYEFSMQSEVSDSNLNKLNVKDVLKMYTSSLYRAYINTNGEVFVQGRISDSANNVIEYTDFTKVDFPEKIVDIGELFQGIICLSESGKLYFIGQDTYCIVSDDTSKVYTSSTLIEKLDKKVVNLDVAESYVVVQTEDNEFYSWGYNLSVINPEKYNEKVSQPQKLDLPKDVVYYNLGNFSAIAITSTGEIYGLGSNYYKLFCNASLPKHNFPTKINLKKVI